MSPRIDRYWADIFGLQPEDLRKPGITVVPHARSWKDTFAYALVHEATCVISVGAALVENIQTRVAGISTCDILKANVLRRAFSQPIDHTVGPAFQGYAEVEDFRPHPCADVRALGSSDEKALRDLAEVCDPVEWEHSGITSKSSPLFGVFDADQIVAASHYSMWANYAASIGVMARPTQRGRGYGKAAVSASMHDAFAHGHMVVYQTLLDNVPSVSVAKRLGCKLYAQTVAVHFQQS